MVKRVLAEHWALPGVSHQLPTRRCHSSFIHLPALNSPHLRPLSLVPDDKARDWAVLQAFRPNRFQGAGQL